MGLSDSRPRLPEVISFLAELGALPLPPCRVSQALKRRGSSADLFTRAVPFHPGKLGECSHPLLLRRFLASSVSADWPLPLLSRGRFRVRLHYSSRVCRTGLRLSELLLQTPVWLHVERVIHMMISFQITRSARLFLAHRNGANGAHRVFSSPPLPVLDLAFRRIWPGMRLGQVVCCQCKILENSWERLPRGAVTRTCQLRRVVRKPAFVLLLPVIAPAFPARKPILAARPCLAAFALVPGWWPAIGPQFTTTASSCLPATGDRFGLRAPLSTFGWETMPRVGMPVEARKEISEEYSAVRGFFGNMPGDAGDLVRVRTNYRKGEGAGNSGECSQTFPGVRARDQSDAETSTVVQRANQQMHHGYRGGNRLENAVGKFLLAQLAPDMLRTPGRSPRAPEDRVAARADPSFSTGISDPGRPGGCK